MKDNKILEKEKELEDEIPIKKKAKKGRNWVQVNGHLMIESWQWGIFMAVVTIYTLFFDDIRVICIPKKYDDFFYFLTTVSLCLFTFEIILACYCSPGYFNSFFFWLDVLATGSMIFDIGWIMDNIGFIYGSGASDATSIAKTSRAARVTRIVRLVRLIRLVRIVKLYKQAKKA